VNCYTPFTLILRFTKVAKLYWCCYLSRSLLTCSAIGKLAISCGSMMRLASVIETGVWGLLSVKLGIFYSSWKSWNWTYWSLFSLSNKNSNKMS